MKESYTYDAFGTAYRGDLSGINSIGYNGKRFDPVLTLYNYGFRDYSPRAARWTTPDPIRAGKNWYVYVNNDPINRIDPFGLVDVNTMLVGKEQIDQGKLLQTQSYQLMLAAAAAIVATEGEGRELVAELAAQSVSMLQQGVVLEASGRATMEAGAAMGNTQDAATNSAARVQAIFDSLANGENRGVKVVKSEEELKSVYNAMANGGSVSDRERYSGVAVVLPDGSQIGYRTKSESGGPTIDIQYPGSKTQYKVHLCGK